MMCQRPCETTLSRASTGVPAGAECLVLCVLGPHATGVAFCNSQQHAAQQHGWTLSAALGSLPHTLGQLCGAEAWTTGISCKSICAVQVAMEWAHRKHWPGPQCWGACQDRPPLQDRG